MTRDKFINRLLIPINDEKGRVVGFTGRVFPFDQNPNRPKYLNSAESDIFKKSNILFGLDKAIKTIRQERWLIIVEGNMDVISAYRYGIKNIIASQGTSFTDNQVKLLKRSRAKKILIAFDNDNAGLISGRKLFLKLINNGFEVYKFVIPEEFKDIDDYLPTLSQKVILKDAQSDDFETIDYMQFELNSITPHLQSDKNDIVRKYIYQYLEILAFCPDILQEQYLNKLEIISSLGKNTLSKILEEFKKDISNEKMQIDFDTEELATNKVQKINLQNGVTGMQNLICLSYKQKLDDKLSNKLIFGYKLIKFLHPDTFVQEDLEEYKQVNSEKLDLIYQNLNSKTTTDIIIMFNKIKDYIRSSEVKIFTNPELKKEYLYFFTN